MAANSDVVLIVGATFTVIERDLVATTPSESVALTEKVCEVAEVPTVPLMTPDRALRLNPVGSVPVETVHEPNGDVPPAVWIVCAYPVCLSVAVARVVVDTLGGTFTVIVSDFVAVTPSASVKATVNVWDVADAPTGPLIVPDVVLRLKPVGKEPTLTDHNPYGVVPPDRASVWE